MKKPTVNMKKTNAHTCTICYKPYRKQDFSLCPHCGGDGGGLTPKVWKPTKKQSKEFAKKQVGLN